MTLLCWHFCHRTIQSAPMPTVSSKLEWDRQLNWAVTKRHELSRLYTAGILSSNHSKCTNANSEFKDELGILIPIIWVNFSGICTRYLYRIFSWRKYTFQMWYVWCWHRNIGNHSHVNLHLALLLIKLFYERLTPILSPFLGFINQDWNFQNLSLFCGSPPFIRTWSKVICPSYQNEDNFLVNPRKSYATKKLHNKKGYISKIVLKTTLQKNYIHSKNYKHKKWLGKSTFFIM